MLRSFCRFFSNFRGISEVVEVELELELIGVVVFCVRYMFRLETNGSIYG